MAHQNMTQQVVPNSSSTSPQKGNGIDSLQKMTPGPAALAQKLIYEIMAMYADILSKDSEQQNMALQALNMEAQAQAKATIAGGKAAGSAMIVAGALTIAGGAASVGGGLLSLRGTKGLVNQQKELEGQMQPLKAIEPLTVKAEPSGETGGLSVDKTKIDGLVEEFKAGNFERVNENPVASQRAINRMKAETGFDFDEWKIQNNKTLDRLTNEHSSVTGKISTLSNTYQMWTQGSTQVLSGAGTTAQGIGQAAKAVHDADATLNGAAQAQASATANDFSSQMNTASTQMSDAVKALAAIQQANNIRG